MVVAVQSGHAAMAVRFGHSALFELERKTLKAEDGEDNGPEVRLPRRPFAQAPASSLPVLAAEILIWQSRALVELGAGAALRGLRAWTLRVFKANMRWMDAAADLADGRFVDLFETKVRLEPALAALRLCLLEEKQSESMSTVIRDLVRHSEEKDASADARGSRSSPSAESDGQEELSIRIESLGIRGHGRDEDTARL